MQWLARVSLISLLCSLQPTVWCQDLPGQFTGWIDEASGTENALHDVKLQCADEAWAVGEFDTIIYSGDDGKTWTSKPSNLGSSHTGMFWNSVSFPKRTYPNPDYKPGRWPTLSDCNAGYVVGRYGNIIFSDDLGGSWRIQDNFIWDYKTELQAHVAVKEIHSVMAAEDTNVAWAVGEDGLIFGTTDFGESWHVQNSRVDFDLHDVFLVSNMSAFVVGDNATLLFTTNGGRSWLTKDSGLEQLSHYHFKGIKCYLDQNSTSPTYLEHKYCWVVGSGGFIAFSDDLGESWTQQESCATADLYDLVFRYSVTEGWVVGDEGITCQTLNYGQTWLLQFQNNANHIYSVTSYNEEHPLAVGDFGELDKGTSGHYLVDGRYGSNEAYFSSGTIGLAWQHLYIDGIRATISWDSIPVGRWANVHLEVFDRYVFTDDVNFMAKVSGGVDSNVEEHGSLHGKLSEVYLWSAQLNDYQMYRLSTGFDQTAPNEILLACYSAEEGSGDVIYDVTHNYREALLLPVGTWSTTHVASNLSGWHPLSMWQPPPSPPLSSTPRLHLTPPPPASPATTWALLTTWLV
ncbi:hypothetical protein CYMTET_46618 [Cymbomonas tetramitiformis]|uniref:Photosynthesis system II assembly factor Ycf48/Hcf136-like domain-containing protein n=1 Tax=Cymbomonas tetramitiformis TaxID=36881 RepID=A0AAE0BXT6_9CHLO|nr:hypothetical protein CYMTET_46618 [Cymbomonas tetramitiformis]